MSSVCYHLIMDRERFLRFIPICKALLCRRNEHEVDYKTVKAICQCESYRQVLSIMEAYNNKDFEDLIYTQQVLPRKLSHKRVKNE